VPDLTGFEAALDGTAVVITGKGSLDPPSLSRKAPAGVARAAARRGIPVVAVAGRSTLTPPQPATAGITAVYTLSDLARSRAEAGVGHALARGRFTGR